MWWEEKVASSLLVFNISANFTRIHDAKMVWNPIIEDLQFSSVLNLEGIFKKIISYHQVNFIYGYLFCRQIFRSFTKYCQACGEIDAGGYDYVILKRIRVNTVVKTMKENLQEITS